MEIMNLTKQYFYLLPVILSVALLACLNVYKTTSNLALTDALVGNMETTIGDNISQLDKRISLSFSAILLRNGYMLFVVSSLQILIIICGVIVTSLMKKQFIGKYILTYIKTLTSNSMTVLFVYAILLILGLQIFIHIITAFDTVTTTSFAIEFTILTLLLLQGLIYLFKTGNNNNHNNNNSSQTNASFTTDMINLTEYNEKRYRIGIFVVLAALCFPLITQYYRPVQVHMLERVDDQVDVNLFPIAALHRTLFYSPSNHINLQQEYYASHFFILTLAVISIFLWYAFPYVLYHHVVQFTDMFFVDVQRDVMIGQSSFDNNNNYNNNNDDPFESVQSVPKAKMATLSLDLVESTIFVTNSSKLLPMDKLAAASIPSVFTKANMISTLTFIIHPFSIMTAIIGFIINGITYSFAHTQLTLDLQNVNQLTTLPHDIIYKASNVNGTLFKVVTLLLAICCTPLFFHAISYLHQRIKFFIASVGTFAIWTSLCFYNYRYYYVSMITDFPSQGYFYGDVFYIIPLFMILTGGLVLIVETDLCNQTILKRLSYSSAFSGNYTRLGRDNNNIDVVDRDVTDTVIISTDDDCNNNNRLTGEQMHYKQRMNTNRHTLTSPMSNSPNDGMSSPGYGDQHGNLTDLDLDDLISDDEF